MSIFFCYCSRRPKVRYCIREEGYLDCLVWALQGQDQASLEKTSRKGASCAWDHKITRSTQPEIQTEQSALLRTNSLLKISLDFLSRRMDEAHIQSEISFSHKEGKLAQWGGSAEEGTYPQTCWHELIPYDPYGIKKPDLPKGLWLPCECHGICAQASHTCKIVMNSFGKELTLSFVRKYMELEFIILNEIKPTQKNNYDPFSQTEGWDVHRGEYGQSTVDLNEYTFMKAISLYTSFCEWIYSHKSFKKNDQQ